MALLPVRDRRIRWLRLYPAQVFVLGFVLMILAGALLLMLPASRAGEEGLSFVDALFTSVSAVCVTGLVVVDTGTHFSVFGQTVILLLMQVGGLGFMAMATLFALVFKRRISLRERLLLQESMNQNTMEGIVRLIRKVLIYSLVIEGVGAALFAFRWSFDMSVGRALYFGVFHAVSLFNNAGFDLFGNYSSLTAYAGDPVVNTIAILLIVAGGLGFVVLADLVDFRMKRKLTLHSKVVLSMTGLLIGTGALVILAFEYNNPATLGGLDGMSKGWAALFQAVTPRTAGANTIDIPGMRQATQFFIVILMFIGASPGSTGGGVKTTTFAVMIGAVIAMLRGKEDIVLFRHRIREAQVMKALTVTLLALLLIVSVTTLLSTTENAPFLVLLFESTSAFATVGLSMGLTPELSTAGKLLIAFAMFAGRVGLLTLAFAIGPKRHKQLYRHPEGKMIIG